MAASQNGWVANDPSKVASQLVPGTQVRLRVRTDAPGLLLLEFASAWDREVEDIDNARGALDDWGYAERPVRGGKDISNHASGTAIDLNATKHPLGTEPAANFSSGQIGTIRKLIGITGNVLRWGGDYKGRKDGMHTEVNDGMDLSDCERALQAMRQYNQHPTPGAPPAPSQPPATGALRRVLRYTVGQPVMNGEDVRALQRVLAAWYPALHLEVDGFYGPATANAVRQLQRQAEIAVDGVAGPDTYRELGM